MDKIKIEEIDRNVEEHRCPGYFWCTVATTVYDTHTRERKCLRCWLNAMKERDIEIDYGLDDENL